MTAQGLPKEVASVALAMAKGGELRRYGPVQQRRRLSPPMEMTSVALKGADIRVMDVTFVGDHCGNGC